MKSECNILFRLRTINYVEIDYKKLLMKRISSQRKSLQTQGQCSTLPFHSLSSSKKKRQPTKTGKTTDNKKINNQSNQNLPLSQLLLNNCFQTKQAVTICVPNQRTFHKLKYNSIDKIKRNPNAQKMSEFTLRNNSTDKKQNNQRELQRVQNECVMKPTLNLYEEQPIQKNNKYNGSILSQICERSVKNQSTLTGSDEISLMRKSLFGTSISKNQMMKNGQQFRQKSRKTSQDYQKSLQKRSIQSKKNYSQRKKSTQYMQHLSLTNSTHPIMTGCLFSSYNSIANKLSSTNHHHHLSTLDSCRIKEQLNQGSNYYQDKDALHGLSSKLCESIKFHQPKQIKIQDTNIISPVSFKNDNQNNYCPYEFEFDGMKDSLIDKLNIFSKYDKESPKNQQLKINKKINKDFIRSSNKNIIIEGNDNEQDKIDSKQSIEPRNRRQKIASLDDCTHTIVSRYNKSSDKKSILQESNIVFQASKMVEFQDDIQKKSNYSDSQHMSSTELHKDSKHKIYSSFIQQPSQGQFQEMVNSHQNGFLSKKIKTNFLRENTGQKQIEEMQKSRGSNIRFDLDTFIEYGPIN